MVLTANQVWRSLPHCSTQSESRYSIDFSAYCCHHTPPFLIKSQDRPSGCSRRRLVGRCCLPRRYNKLCSLDSTYFQPPASQGNKILHSMYYQNTGHLFMKKLKSNASCNLETLGGFQVYTSLTKL